MTQQATFHWFFVAMLATLAPMTDVRAEDTEESAAAPPPAQLLERVEVVGSRIKRVDVETSQPVLVLERADIDRTGLISVGDILQQIVVNGPDLNTRFNDGDGEDRINLRSLGSNRTLVLVNGRRWVSELDGAVDVSTIPLAIVERIEVLKDGASSIYGSDAIAGVVNITTRKHYEGAEVHAHVGAYQQGDGRTEAYNFTLGADRGRANVALNVSYQKEEPVFARDRTISAVPFYFPGTSGNDECAEASPTTPNGRFIVPGRFNGAPFFCTADGPDIRVPGLTLIAGRPGTSPDDFRVFDPASDSYNFAPARYLLAPNERTSLYVQGRYALSDAVSFSTQAMFSERRSEQLAAPLPLQIDPAYAGAQGNVGISADNLYNPFGVDIDSFRRRFVESGGRRFAEDIDVYRFAGGFDGNISLGDRQLSWEAHALYSREDDNQINHGFSDLQRVANALGPSFLDAQGVPRCGFPDAVIEGCVPLNVFGGAGSITPEMADYISIVTHDSQRIELTSYAANVTGDLINLPAGPLSAAAGFEYRREFGTFNPDALTAAGRVGGLGGTPTQGGQSVGEEYLELNVPLLAERRYAQTLELNLAARRSDYSTFGVTTNAKVGFRWKPFADLLVRGNWSQGFRAPSVKELFDLAPAAPADGLGDPCHPSSNPTAAVLSRCAAAGVPANYDLPAFVNTFSGGNPELQPETAVTRTLGLVYSPSWIGGTNLYLDWYNIQIDQSIGELGAEGVLVHCYVLADPSACARITRNAAGQLFIVNATLQNLSTGFETEGYDFSLDWHRTTDYGKFGVRWDTAYVDYFGDRGRPARLTRRADGTLLQGNRVATGEEWRIRSNLTLSWLRGDWSASITGRYVSPLEQDCTYLVALAQFRQMPQFTKLCNDPNRVVDLDGDGIGDPAATHLVDAVWYFDLQAGWDAPWKARLTAGVRNVFNRNPPLATETDANSFLPAYDIPGRFWYFEYTQKF